jgi:hypothetical protein
VACTLSDETHALKVCNDELSDAEDVLQFKHDSALQQLEHLKKEVRLSCAIVKITPSPATRRLVQCCEKADVPPRCTHLFAMLCSQRTWSLYARAGAVWQVMVASVRVPKCTCMRVCRDYYKSLNQVLAGTPCSRGGSRRTGAVSGGFL